MHACMHTSLTLMHIHGCMHVCRALSAQTTQQRAQVQRQSFPRGGPAALGTCFPRPSHHSPLESPLADVEIEDAPTSTIDVYDSIRMTQDRRRQACDALVILLEILIGCCVLTLCMPALPMIVWTSTAIGCCHRGDGCQPLQATCNHTHPQTRTWC